VSELVELAATLLRIPSPSRSEGAIADLVEARLRGASHLEVQRLGDNVVARSQLGRRIRVIVAGHLDTVPLSDGEPSVVDGELVGLGAVDMKGSLAAMLLAALALETPTVDVSWVFYAREEVARAESGLREIVHQAPALLEGDVAILGEPTDGAVEAGCQGTLHARVHLGGIEAHSARPFMGVNAIHRVAALLELVADAPLRQVNLDGVTFVEQLQAVMIEGGRARNVVPASAELTLNYRFAPDREASEAEHWIAELLVPLLDEELGDSISILESAGGAKPNLSHPVLARLVELSDRPVAAKVGWTDVATFAELGIPAANFGAGDPLLAHHPGERLSRASLEAYHSTLLRLLEDPSLS
jgi:succinyl-diaminopimelate desuccinylase